MASLLISASAYSTARMQPASRRRDVSMSESAVPQATRLPNEPRKAAMGQSTRPLRSSRLRGAKSREAASRSRGQLCQLARSTQSTRRRARHDQDQQDHLRTSTRHAASHIDPPITRRQIRLNERTAQTSLLECAVDIFARKTLIHSNATEQRSTDYRAMVVGCVVSATRNYLK